jgi:hypothetical protein
MPGHIGTDIIGNSQYAHGQPVATSARDAFRDAAPLGPAGAATIILDGVRAGQWRILVGGDAVALDARVRADPESAYEPSFIAATFPALASP